MLMAGIGLFASAILLIGVAGSFWPMVPLVVSVRPELALASSWAHRMSGRSLVPLAPRRIAAALRRRRARSRRTSPVMAKIAVTPPCMNAVPKPRTIQVAMPASGMA